MKTIDIGLWRMLLIYLLAFVPIALLWFHATGLVKDTVSALTRMTVQLALVGLYLSVIFELNNLYLNVAWALFMVAVADAHVIRAAKVNFSMFWLSTFISILAGAALALAALILVAVRPTPIYDARYLVPLTGMLLGNCLRSNVISLERFYSSVAAGRKETQTLLGLGATLKEAIQPYMRQAMRASVTPRLTTMATMGLVSLPGMMTGQILGGEFPAVAIKYQIAIMICIFAAATVTSVLNIALSLPAAFDEYGNFRPEVIARDHK